MKLAIATACLLVSLGLASHALADGRTTVTLQQPLAKPTQVIVNGAIWDCAQSQCSADVPPEDLGVGECHAVARKVGPIADFKNDVHTLEPASLDKCNTGVAPKQSMTASR
jgi:hypothetical protein